MKRNLLLIIAAVSLAAPLAVASATAEPAQSNPSVQPATPREAPLDMTAVPTLSPDKIREVQQALHDKGIDPGPIDGVPGPKTKDGIRTFQDRYGVKPSGEIDNQTLYALGKAALAGPKGNGSDRN